jgi:hypothetical protein
MIRKAALQIGVPALLALIAWNAYLAVTHVLEFRDETSWALLPQTERHASVDKGWYRTTPQELVEILESAGVIKTESNQ